MAVKEYAPLVLSQSTQILSTDIELGKLPAGLVLRANLGLVSVGELDGIVLHRAENEYGDLLFEVRATITPKGDLLVMFPDGNHYGGQLTKTNSMLAYRSTDKGRTWAGPSVAMDIDYNQHGFIPLIPAGSDTLYCFGTQPVRGELSAENGQAENAPIGYFRSDDDGHTWMGPTLIRPVNDPGFKGMSVTRMCETDAGTWLLGSHEGHWQYKPLKTRQYILRSDDKGKTWELLPNKRPDGWCVPEFGRMDEGRTMNLGHGKALAMFRTPEGHIWASWSDDDGKTWTEPEPTSLVNPDAPPMVFHLSDGKTLACFHHNRHHDTNYSGLSQKADIMKDRSEVWVSFSYDDGHSWSEPGFLFSNATEPDLDSHFRNHQCSYLDVVVDGDMLHIFVPHRWQQVLYLTIREKDLLGLPLQGALEGEIGKEGE